MVWAVLPLKDFVDAKQRLSSILTAQERSGLFQCMVEDVLEVLLKQPEIQQVVIVSDNEQAKQLAKKHNILYWSEASLQSSGLNDVVNSAAARLHAQGVSNLMVIHGDLPLLSNSDLQLLLDKHQQTLKQNNHRSLVSIVPDTVECGSNCLISTPPGAISFQYGENSFNHHIAQAKANAVATQTVHIAGIARDIDHPSDVTSLLLSSQNKRCITYLKTNGIAKRFQLMMAASDHKEAEDLTGVDNITIKNKVRDLL